MLIIAVVIYLLITFILTITGYSITGAGLKVLLLSLLLTPIAGIIYMLKERQKVSSIRYYYCPECEYIFPIKMSHCPICAEEHKKIRLTKYVSPNDVTKSIGTLQLT